MRVKELGIALLLSAAMASVVRAQTATVPIIATPVAAPQPADVNGTSNPPFTPGQIQQAYGLNLIQSGSTASGLGQTIAIIDAYNYPNAVSALNTFSSEFGLPQVNAGGPTFTVLNQSGGTTLPGTDPAGPYPASNWEFEEALDIEWAHAMAPNANIVLYEATNNSNANLFAAVNTAKNNAAVAVVSMSFGSGEYSGETSNDSTFTTPAGRLAANPKQGMTFVAATGDSGAPGNYPAFSPNVVAVGGTSLYLTTSLSYSSESAWSGSGGGTSSIESKPSYQISYGTLHGGLLANTTSRATPDVSFDADPNTGVYTYDPYNGGWFQIGGTSLSAPCWAGLIADADQIRVAAGKGTLDGASQTLPALYSLSSSDFHDVTTGNNGFAAGPGYDLATGLGTPVANKLVPDLAAYGVSPATISLGSVVNARAMSGVAGTLGATVTNSAASGSNNLNYTLAAAVPSGSGSATLGTVSPGSDSLASGASDANTVSATSTNLGLNTITFTASDPNASNSPQTINATLTVVANRLVTATPVSFGILHAGQMPAGSYSTTLSTAGDNNHYTAVTVPGGSDGLVTVQGTSTVFNSNGQSETRAVTAGAFNTAGLINSTIPLATVGQGLAGESPIPVQVSYTATVFSGSASWTGSAGSSWGTNGSWQDTQAAGVQVAPGQFAGYSDTAVLNDSAGGSRSITLDGASPQLSSLVFSATQSGYSVGPGTGGTLQFSNGAGTATLLVTAGSQTISAPIAFSGNGAINLAAQTQLTVSGNVSGGPTVANDGMLIFSTAAQTVGAITGNGALDVTGGATITAASVAQNSIEIDAGAKLALTEAHTAVVSTANSLSIAGATGDWTGDLDVGASGITLSNATLAEAATVANELKEGYSGGTWAGAGGITSSFANTHQGAASVGEYYSSTAQTLKIAAAIPGDCVLSGQVTASDLNTVEAHLGASITAGENWQSGDFTYSGQVTAADLNTVEQHLGASFPAVEVGGLVQFDAVVGVPQAIAAGTVAPVPEPGTLALLAAGLAVAGIAAVRRRAKHAG